MPRGPRLDAPEILHHVRARGIERRDIFLSDLDREDFLARLERLCESGAFTVFAWCLMGNHFHLAVRTENRPLKSAMSSLLTGYASTFNKRHRRVGHLFQNRYKSDVVEDERYFLALIRYIHLNPVRARTVKNLEELASHRWSGHATLMGTIKRPWQETDEVLSRFGKRAGAARRGLVEFMGSAESKREEKTFKGGGLIRSAGGMEEASELRGESKWAYDERILGSGAFVESVLERLEAQSKTKTAKRVDSLAAFERMKTLVAEKGGITRAELLSGGRQRALVRLRRIIAYMAVKQLGLRMSEVARDLNVSLPSILTATREGERHFEEMGWDVDDLSE